VWFLLSIGTVVCKVSDLIAFVAGTVGVSVDRLGLGHVHLVDIPLFVLHLDCSSLGVSVSPVVVLVGLCAVCVDVHRDRGIV
jgi:hypothetical protein